MIKEFKPQTTLTFEAIGTKWIIELQAIASEMSAPDQATLLDEILTIIDQYDRLFSRFRPDSLVSTMAKQSGKYQLPSFSEQLFDLYDQLWKRTDQRMTPLIGQMLSQLGYDTNYSFQPSSTTPILKWGTDVYFKDNALHLNQPALIDIGALGKGQLVDLVIEHLRQYPFKVVCVNAGGDIYYHHHEALPLAIALEHPQQTSQAIGIANIANQAICGSSGNRRRWHDYHHIIDPSTAQPVQNIATTWAVAPTALQADAISTALFFAEPERLKMDFPYDYAIIYSDMSLVSSDSFPAKFFTQP